MNKNVFFFLMCTFAMIGVAQAQHRSEIQLNASELSNVMISQDRLPSEGRVLGSPTSAIIRHHKSSASECPSIGVTCSPQN